MKAIICLLMLFFASVAQAQEKKPVRFEKWEFVGLIDETPEVKFLVVKTQEASGLRIIHQASGADQINNIKSQDIESFRELIETFVEAYPKITKEFEKTDSSNRSEDRELKKDFHVGKVKGVMRMTKKSFICEVGRDRIDYEDAKFILKCFPLVKPYIARANEMIKGK